MAVVVAMCHPYFFIMKNIKCRWHGECVEFNFVNVKLKSHPKVLHWTNYYVENFGVNHILPGIEIFVTENPIVISNVNNRGIHKLLNHGWPEYPHNSFDLDFCTTEPSTIEIIELYGFDVYLNHVDMQKHIDIMTDKNQRKIHQLWFRTHFKTEMDELDKLLMLAVNKKEQ